MRKALSLMFVFALLAMALPTLASAQEPISDPAQLVPADAPFYLSLDTRTGFAVRVERLLSRLAGQDVAGQGDLALDQVVQMLLGNPGASFVRDVRPWLGDQIAITNPQMPSMSALMMMANAAAPPPGIAPVLIASVTNVADARNFVSRLLSIPALSDVTSSEMTYNGHDYILVQPADATNQREGLSIGLIGDYLVMAYGPRGIEPIIDTVNGGPSLADAPGFQRIYGEMDPESALRLYIGPTLPAGVVGDPFVWNLLVQSLQASEQPVPGLDLSDPAALQEQILDVIDTFHGIGLDFRTVENALVMDFIGGFDMDALDAVLGAPQPRLEKGVGQEIIARFPADALGVLAWTNVGAGIENWLGMAALQGPGAQADLEQALAEFETQTGMALEDVLAWMRGSIAVGGLENPASVLQPVSVAIVVEATDLDKAQQTLDALSQVAERQGQPVEVAEIDGVQVISIPSTGADQPPVQVAIIDGYVVVMIGEGMARMIATAQGDDNYTQNPEWARLTRIANPDGPFIATLDIAGLAAFAQEAGDTAFMTEADRAMFASLRALQTAAIIAPASPGGGPARFSFILTLAER